VCLTSTHLVFIYEDEVSDLVLLENGWNRETINEFWSSEGRRKTNKSSSRGTTPVNVPLDELGEGGGVELIGTVIGGEEAGMKDDDGCDRDIKADGSIDFSDMFECGFDEIESIEPISPTLPEESEKENEGDRDNSSGGDMNDQPPTVAESTGRISSNTDIAVICKTSRLKKKGKVSIRQTEKGTDPDMAASFSQEIPPMPTAQLSSSSSNSSEENSIDGDVDISGEKPPSTCDESNNENEVFMLAMLEEARRRNQELEDDEEAKMSTVASCSTWEREEQTERYMRVVDSNIIDGLDLENDASVFGTQTNVSSFSELDMEIDPGQERELYISTDDKYSKQFFIGIKWPLSKLSEIYPRSYMMKDVAFEIFAPSPSTSSLYKASSSHSISMIGGNTSEKVDVVLGPLSNSSIFLVIPDSDNTRSCDDESITSLSRFARKPKIKSRRESVVQELKDHVPQLNFSFWDILHTIQSNSLLSNTPLEGIENKFEGTIRRGWTPTSLFRRGNEKTDPLSVLTRAWKKGKVSNFDYLSRLNAIAGRSIHDPGNYPVMPWVLSNYVSNSVPDLSDIRNFRDMSKPMGTLSPERLQKFMAKYDDTKEIYGTDSAIPPFMYGSHYSSIGGVVLHYLLRVKPFAGLHRQLQGGKFDFADRLFRSVAQTWEKSSREGTDVRELTPEWYSDPAFLKNEHNFNLGTSVVDGHVISDVMLPPWADNNPYKFIEVMREALECDLCSKMLPSWIDLIFGFKQRGPEAVYAQNLFYHLTYYGPEDLAKIEDEAVRTDMELHISDFGRCPSQLFVRPHPQKKAECLY